MSAAAVVTTFVMWIVFIGVLAWCFTRVGRGGKWED